MNGGSASGSASAGCVPPRPFPLIERVRRSPLRKLYTRLLTLPAVHSGLNRWYGSSQSWRRPVLAEDTALASIVDTLKRDGIATTDFSTVFPDLDFDALCRTFARHQRDYTPPAKTSKSYIHRLLDELVLSPDDVLTQIVMHERLLGLAAGYLELVPRFVSLDLWSTRPAGERKRIASQNWHRDYNDLQMLKIFVYLNDVGPDNGPFTYIRGSHRLGELGRALFRQFGPKGLRRYPTERELEEHEAYFERNLFTGTGRAGTVLLVDTFGFHRGGYVQRGERNLLMALYASPVQLHPANFTIRTDFEIEDPFVRDVFGAGI